MSKRKTTATSLKGSVDAVKFTNPDSTLGGKMPAQIFGINWSPAAGSSIEIWDVSDKADATNFNLVFSAGATDMLATDIDVEIKNGIYVKTNDASDKLVLYGDRQFWSS